MVFHLYGVKIPADIPRRESPYTTNNEFYAAEVDASGRRQAYHGVTVIVQQLIFIRSTIRATAKLTSSFVAVVSLILLAQFELAPKMLTYMDESEK